MAAGTARPLSPVLAGALRHLTLVLAGAMRPPSSVLAGAILLLFPLSAGAQEEEPPAPPRAATDAGTVADTAGGRPSLRAHRLDAEATGGIRLDGLLTEPAWAAAPAAGGFRQREPEEGAPATERTEVRVLYDARAVYVGVVAHDREPGRIIARILQRNRVMQGSFGFGFGFAGDDGIAILFDPFHDHRNGVVFATNPNGAKYDALITDEGQEINDDWRGIWRVAAARTDRGWSAEFEIPFRTLRYPTSASGEPWGFNVFRVIRRKNEEALWTSWSRDNEGFARVSRAGHLEGLTELPRAGLNLEVKPYALSGLTRELEPPVDTSAAAGSAGAGDAASAPAPTTDPRLEAGIDLKYELRPGLVLDLTANPDFAQVEVDDEQVNLTRFSLFFPEKRDFFLENAGIFEFGHRGFGGPPAFLLFFSRRIGIAEGEEVPILGGARLTGRAGRQTVGFLDAVTDGAAGEPAANHAVLRVKRDVGARHVVGAMLTDLRRGEGGSNTAGGLDFSLWPTATVNLRGFLAGTATAGEGGDDAAFMVNLDYTGDRAGFFAQHLFIGPEANAGMGFITRTDIRRSNVFLRLTPRPPALALRKIDFRFQGLHIVRSDGRLQDWEVQGEAQPSWNSGEQFRLSGSRGFTRLDEGFPLTDDVFVPAGDYETWRLEVDGGTSTNRALSLEAEASVERFFEGTLVRVGGTARVDPSPHVQLAAEHTHNDVEVPGGEFTADITSVRLGLAFSTDLTATARLQYNSLERRISANLRVNLIHRPGSDLFLVLDEERGSGDSPWDFRSRGLVVKLTWLARL